jgi:hypothetical protein
MWNAESRGSQDTASVFERSFIKRMHHRATVDGARADAARVHEARCNSPQRFATELPMLRVADAASADSALCNTMRRA